MIRKGGRRVAEEPLNAKAVNWPGYTNIGLVGQDTSGGVPANFDNQWDSLLRFPYNNVLGAPVSIGRRFEAGYNPPHNGGNRLF